MIKFVFGVGADFETARLSAGLTQSELGLLLDVSRQQIGAIEKGIKPFPVSYLAMLPEPIRDPMKQAIIAVKQQEIEELRWA